MTEDAVRSFREALPGFARRDLTLTVQAIVDIRAAVERGHDPAELAYLVAYHTAGLDNGDAVMRWRLRRYAHPAACPVCGADLGSTDGCRCCEQANAGIKPDGTWTWA
jgi:hypothetical protein